MSTPEEIELLVNMRRGNRGFITKTIAKAQEIIPNATSEEVHKLQAIQKTLIERLSLLSSLDDRILDTLTDSDDIEKEIDRSGAFKEHLEAPLFLLEGKIKTRSHENTSDRRTSNEFSINLNVSVRSEAKLPKLTLKSFSGNPLEFQTFWDSFEATVDRNTGLEDMSKFNYLRGLFSGPEADYIKLINGIKLTNENYREAVEILKKRYGNKQLLISTNMDRLLT